VAYCNQSNLDNCSGNWYIYNGIVIALYPDAISGDCTKCTSTSYDEICVTGGIKSNIINGKYKYEGCTQLMPYYVQTNIDGITNLTLYYYSEYNMYVIAWEFNISEVYVYAYCSNDNILECDNNWYVYDEDSNNYILESTLNTGLCSSNDAQNMSPYIIGGVTGSILFLIIAIIIIWYFNCYRQRNKKQIEQQFASNIPIAPKKDNNNSKPINRKTVASVSVRKTQIIYSDDNNNVPQPSAHAIVDTVDDKIHSKDIENYPTNDEDHSSPVREATISENEGVNCQFETNIKFLDVSDWVLRWGETGVAKIENIKTHESCWAFAKPEIARQLGWKG